MSEAVLCLGSNLGNRGYNISMAVRAIENINGIEIVEMSELYETEPFGVDYEQPKYLNCCLKIRTKLQAHVLLGMSLGIEAAMGRKRKGRNESRVIDIDLIFYGTRIYNTKELILPHPRALSRAFVLVPLQDLYPDCKTPSFDFLAELEEVDKSTVKMISN